MAWRSNSSCKNVELNVLCYLLVSENCARLKFTCVLLKGKTKPYSSTLAYKLQQLLNRLLFDCSGSPRDSKDRLLYLIALEFFWVYFKRRFPEARFLYESFTMQLKINLTFQIRNL
ncbi:hypothetical protein AV530_016038 [Patagioenas fasciata monilis]|uniref:Uncharacterized protein n=1 Tax=Patagioenas fasciata monilis TaxID=372326 RepID=A0A1V4KJS0_PATFA|nr:hypothetical protein AV530_016038 [Patagioenas fasciata monilis]